MPQTNPDAYKAYQQAWKAKNVGSRTAYVRDRRRRLRQQMLALRGNQCERCGYNKSTSALEFHHRDPATKRFNLSHKNLTHSWDAIQAEVEKCDLICANCHRELHDDLRVGA